MRSFLGGYSRYCAGFGSYLEFYRLVSAASAQAIRSWMEQDRNSQYIVYVFGDFLWRNYSSPLETGGDFWVSWSAD